MSARAKADDRVARTRAAMGGTGGTTQGHPRPAQTASLPVVPPVAPGAAPPNKLAMALAQMRAGAPGDKTNPGAPGAPSPATTKLATVIGRKGTPIVAGVGEELVRSGFFGIVGGREPQELDADEEDELGEALGGWLATVLPDSAVGPGGTLLIIFALTFAFAWLRGKPLPKPEPKKDEPPRPAVST